jgi:outer membrane receptor protein involved in Fe transport
MAGMTSLRSLLLWCMWSVSGVAGAAESPRVLSQAIEPQPLASALEALGQQTGLTFIFVSSIAEAKQSKGALAGLAPPAALAALLDGTGLQYEFLSARTVRVFATPSNPSSTQVVAPPDRASRRVPPVSAALEEVVVTGTRGNEPLSRVPIDMAVWTESAMESSGIKGIVQIADLTPGLDFLFRSFVGGDFQTNLAIRGVAERHGTTVAIYLDDTRIPPGYSVSYLRSFPVTLDVDRVEVLRGPQGTLLGDHTQGGAIRYVANQPSLTDLSAMVRTEVAATTHGGVSYEAGSAVGGPVVEDVLGFRLSGWYRSDAGYVDRVDPVSGATVEANANRYLTSSARAALTLAPVDTVRITPSLTYQSLNIHDTSSFDITFSDPSTGVLRNDSFRAQPFDNYFYLASLKVTSGLFGAGLSAVTSYFDGESNATLDASTGPAALAAYYQAARQREFTQELRLNSADTEARLAWLAGAFFSSNHTSITDRLVGIFPYSTSPIAVPTDIGDETIIDKTSLEGFGDVSLKITTRLTLSAGLRVGHTQFNGNTQLAPAFHASDADTWTAPRFVLSYQGVQQSLLYLSAAKGYGSGGIYYAFTLGPDPPEAYTPDTLWSYEAGAKLDLDGGRMRLDGSIFHILWNNGPQADYYAHAENTLVPGSAVSNGFDLTTEAFLTEHLLGRIAIAYTDARYIHTVVTYGTFVTVRAGDAVGLGSPWSLTGSLDQTFLLSGNLACTLRVEDAFHSHNPRSFYEENPESQYYQPGWHPDPSINILNARATLRWSHFEVAAFINNALNSQPSLALAIAPMSAVRGSWAHTVTPRTLGASGTWRF